MSELLARLLQTPGEFTSRLPDLKSSSPPPGITKQQWELRHELPLHLINFLRDEAEPLFSLAQRFGATPGKTNRPAKYDYNSPLKLVPESPGKTRALLSENNKKPKKKVRLFPAKITGRVNKSFSDVEEQLDLRIETVNRIGNSNSGLEGVRQLPLSPKKSSQKNGFKKSQSTSLFSVPENSDHSAKTFGEKRIEIGTPSTDNVKQFNKKQSLSPQTLSLADFMAPMQRRGGGKNNKTPRSPSKVKSSTPIEDHVVPRVANNLSVKMIQLDLSSADSFPEIGEPAAIKKKRMKPTLLNSNIDSEPVNPVFGQKTMEITSGQTESPFMVEEVDKKNFDTREMVREIQSMTTPFKSLSGNKMTPNKTPTLSRSNSVISTNLVIPSHHAVEKSEYLNLLATLYSYVFNNNLMPNFYVEIYFVIELLLLDVPQDYESRQKESSALYLSSIHNCVHFACQVISRTVELFVFLDKTTLRLLMDNSRISQFCPDLSEQLVEVYENKCIPSPLMVNRANRSHQSHANVSFLTVSFQSETDNRSNFPSNSSFHDFKKQRDKFYFLIRKWGENMKGKDVQFEAAFSVEVEKVMVMYQHPVNYYHFAKLWMAQLVAMCCGESLEDAQSDSSKSLMTELKNIDPMKHKRLAARLVTPGRCGGPCPPPSFSGAAEFFRDFILVCNSPKFVRHLRDLLVSEVMRLNSIQLDIGEGSHGVSKEDSLGWEMTEAGGYNEVLVDQYQETLITLRILAKFLGFIESFPYYESSELSSAHVSVSVEVRSQTCMALDVARLVVEAMDSGRLVLTIPWVVEFLCQLDQAAHQLPYYSSLYTRLASIYQTRLAPASCLVSPHTAHFLSLYLGWLFEKKTFPREVLILSQVNGADSQKLPCGDSLDLAEVVTSGLVRQCCPWVGEVRTLLQQWEGGKRGSQLSLDKSEAGGTYRKITPLAAPLDKKGKLDKESVAQTRLEESFFHNQPKSLRRTVEYVSERMASDVIKKIRQIVVPGEKKKFTECLKEAKLSGVLVSKVSQYSQQSYDKVRAHTDTRLGDSLRSDCEAVLLLLLAFDTSPAVRGTCVSICVRTVAEKVGQWLEQHVTREYFSREYTMEAERLARQATREQATNREAVTPFIGPHEADGTPGSKLLILLKTQIKSLMIDERTDIDLSSDSLVSVISRILHCVRTRCELTQLAVRAFESLSLDWILTLVTKRPEAVSEAVISALLDFWSVLPPSQLVSVLCPRNLFLLATSSSPDLTWLRVRDLLEALIRSGLLTALALEDSCMSLTHLAKLDNDLLPHLKRLSETLRFLANSLDTENLDWVNIITQEIIET